MLLNNIRWGLMDAKFRGENLLRAGGVPYTVVRPGGLTNDPPGQRELVVSELSHRRPVSASACVCCMQAAWQAWK
jgi:hypothetical protein